jgi:hypothetical protein
MPNLQTALTNMATALAWLRDAVVTEWLVADRDFKWLAVPLVVTKTITILNAVMDLFHAQTSTLTVLR